MDDLNLLRDLGQSLEHEPPASLVRQRHLLTDAANGAGRRARRRPRRWILIATAAAVTAALILVPTVLLQAGGSSKGGGPLNAGPGPMKPGKPINILVLGSDARRGDSEARSDSIVLLHLSGDRKRVNVVSIPRDVMTDVPSCKTPSGKAAPGRRDIINSAFATGGLSCAAESVESMTDVRLDHALSIDFGGFTKMVNALGGIELVVPQAVDVPGLKLTVGRHSLNGTAALAYARARHGIGDGSDLDRVRRQQNLISGMVRKANDLKLRNPVRLAAFIKATSEAVRTWKGLDLKAMQTIAKSLEHTGPDQVGYSVVPVKPDSTDPNRLALAPSAASLFARIRNDK
ncbi:LCP family protein [Actinomadura barringtoniae]|uniref:LCP family protein n=1 Tax=Actinomadura barringtoniae TaxID=1427535 RepID=A0A939T1T2_9ACTN|nr:LCP family protein [Actinomadura barringtoniae]MBO2448221.1 LCP family protein [Actinomadura barringtoniae]